MAEPMFEFLRLPDDVVLRVMENLQCKSLLSLQQTCHKLETLIRESLALQYIIRLAAAGLRPGADSDVALTSRERLDRLRLYETARAEFTWTEAPYAGPHLDDMYEPRINGNFRADRHGLRDIYVTQMPSPLRGVEFRQWKVTSDFPLQYYHIDPTQDLLILLSELADDRSGTVHAYSLSMGGHHPLCTWPAERSLRDRWARFARIHGDYVALQSASETRSLVLWNWKTGSVEARSSLRGAHRSNRFRVFPISMFLDDSHILVLSIESGEPASSAGSGAYLQVYAFRRPLGLPESDWEPLLCCQFALPAVHDTTHMFFLPPTTLSWSSNSQEPGLFHPDRDGLIGIVLNGEDPARKRHDIYVYIPIPTILAHLPTTRTEPLLLPWKAWGPNNTFVRVTVRGEWLDFRVYGMNVLHRGDTMIEIHDYHPRHVAQARAFPDSIRYPKIGDFGLVVRRRLFNPQDATTEFSVVETGLPFILTEIELPVAWRQSLLAATLFDECMTIEFVKSGNTPERRMRLLMHSTPS